ncbi:Protein kinase domain-containing protein [Deinococcus saxicola]|uniref:hypothetical protein n=1 Tax=Deinococcus saxicola TaxID=249406 RepID=UPI0039EFE41B
MVHHLNGDKQDFCPENLLALPSQDTYMGIEHIERERLRGRALLLDLDQMGLGSVDLPPDSSGQS